MSTIVVELYQALREAGVDEKLARDAAHAVLGTDMKHDLATKADLADLRTELAGIRAEIANSRVEMIKWNVGAMTALATIFAAISRLS